MQMWMGIYNIYFLTFQSSDKLGLSLELGSFAAGVMISTTDFAQHTFEQVIYSHASLLKDNNLIVLFLLCLCFFFLNRANIAELLTGI